MSDINERLDNLKKLIQEEDFLQGRGLSNEVNIRMFCYDPKEEMIVRSFIEKRLNPNSLKCSIQIVDLYETFLKICEEMDILEAIPEIEQEEGREFLERQLENVIDDKVFANYIVEHFDNQDVLMITGVGKVFPFMRVHSLLSALQSDLNDKPIIVLYPGTFDGHYVKLFNQLKANEYYRAFNII